MARGREKKTGWHFIFPIEQFHSPEEIQAMRDFLWNRLRKPNVFKITESSLIIVSEEKDEGFKAAVFVVHENPLKRDLFYTIHGYGKEGDLIFDSSEKKNIDKTEPIVVMEKVTRGGRVTIPKNIRIVMNLVEGDTVVLKLEEGKRIVIYPSWREKENA